MEKGKFERAIFAGGCFWCMVKPFETWPGIINVTSGYTGGTKPNPTYEEVCRENTGHYEAVEIIFDPALFSYNQLLDIYWQQIDPTDPGGQFYDRGRSYQTAIFYCNEEQMKAAEQSRLALAKSGKFQKPIVTQILPAQEFFPAEEYHQQYYKKNSAHYQRYFQGSGRAAFIEKYWGDPNERG